jgi:predicted PurR-regulated permease PerM
MPDPKSPPPSPPLAPPPPAPAPEKRKLPAVILLSLAMIGLLMLAGLILFPFVGPIVIALVLAVIGRPFFTFLLRRIGEKWRGTAAALSCATLLILTFAPLTWIGWSIANEAPAGLAMIEKGIQDTRQKLDQYTWFAHLKNSRWFQSLCASLETIKRSIRDGLEEGQPATPAPGDQPPPPPLPSTPQAPEAGGEKPMPIDGVVPAGVSVARWITGIGAELVGNALELFLKFFLMVFILYYFLKDGPEILASLKRAIPMDESYQDRVVETFGRVSRSIIRGSVGTALIQGAVAAIAFLFVGIPAVFWGVLVAFSSLIPPLGTSLIMVPVTVFMFLGGHTGKGVFLLVVMLVIGSLDNIVRPLLVGRTLNLHPIWLLLSVLGALAAFGPLGLIYGPMVLVLLGTVIALLVQEERGS